VYVWLVCLSGIVWGACRRMGEAAREGGKEEAGVRPELTELKIESIFK
jgi:hypothetical protein